MLWRLLLLFTVVPLVELALLLWLSDLTDWKLTVLVILATGLLGAALARRQGWRVWRRIQDELGQGRLPADSLQDGVLVMTAAALLVSPGLLTDLAGFLLLVPPVRGLVKRQFARRLKARFVPMRSQGSARRDDGPAFDYDSDKVIDVPSDPVDPSR
ncbi:MAG: FxsA family protein [Pirellulales bacterium]